MKNDVYFRFKISDRMKKMHLRQKDVAEKLGISQQMFSYKMDTEKFEIGELIALINALEMTDDDILKLVGRR